MPLQKKANGYRKRLWVEGDSELRLLPELLEKELGYWELKGEDAKPISFVVHVTGRGGWRSCLDRDGVSGILKDANVEALGIVVDADSDAEARMHSFRGLFPDDLVEEESPDPHSIIATAGGKSVGLFVMPGGGRRGMLETLLSAEISNLQPKLHAHAESSTRLSKQHGAAFKDADFDKALVHTWLAWQKDPGQAPHIRARGGDFKPSTDGWRLFFEWFTRLFQLEPGKAPALADVHAAAQQFQ